MFWRVLDWGAPWLAPYAKVAWPVIERLEAGQNVARALGDERFVPQSELPEAEAYEAFIGRSGRVPTRDNLHDLLNGIVWLRFPALKRRLNELHAAQLAIEGVQPERGPLRDVLTLFDENGAWWRAPPEQPHDITADGWARKPFQPLPVLGVPGWWRDNEDEGFYTDAGVFRPLRG